MAGRRLRREQRDSRGGIFEQSVVWVEHLFGHEEEPLSGQAAIVQSLLSFKLQPQARLQQLRPLHREDAAVRVLQHSVASDLHLKAVRDISLNRSTIKSIQNVQKKPQKGCRLK